MRVWTISGCLLLLLAATVTAQQEQTARDPVTGKTIPVTERTRRILVNGKPVYFESAESEARFIKEPEKYLKEPLPCPVLGSTAPPSRDARLVVNDSLWYFCCGDCTGTALGQPGQYFKKLRDPVTGKEFTVTPDSPHLLHRGSRYYFATEESRDRFAADPGKYARIPSEP